MSCEEDGSGLGLINDPFSQKMLLVGCLIGFLDRYGEYVVLLFVGFRIHRGLISPRY